MRSSPPRISFRLPLALGLLVTAAGHAAAFHPYGPAAPYYPVSYYPAYPVSYHPAYQTYARPVSHAPAYPAHYGYAPPHYGYAPAHYGYAPPYYGAVLPPMPFQGPTFAPPWYYYSSTPQSVASAGPSFAVHAPAPSFAEEPLAAEPPPARHVAEAPPACAAASARPCGSCGPRTVKDLRKVNADQLKELFTRSELGNVPVGDLEGEMLYLTDRCGNMKLRLANLIWRGKYLGADTYFANRWIGNQRRIGAHYVIGPSWVDGRPAIILEYPPGTPLFVNLHDEMREVAPGLYLGVVYERCPCPKFRGFFAIEIPTCQKKRCCLLKSR